MAVGQTTLAELALVVRADMTRVKPDVVRGADDAGQAGGRRMADSLSKDFATRLNTQLRGLNIKPVDLKLGTSKSDAALASLTKKLSKVRDDSSKPYEVRLKADEALQSVEHLNGKLGDVGKRSKDLSQVADAAGVLGAGLLGAAGVAVKFGADFDKSMSAVAAASNASAGDVDKLRKAAIQAGADTQYSATQAANGITELSKAGVQTADILGGGLKGALSLAAAGQIEVADAAETAASAMTQFKLEGAQIPHVADLLAAGAGKAQGSVADLSAALNQSGLVAAQTGLTIEDTTGTLAAFASAGLTGSDAGTSFKTMLQALQAPSGKTKELMDQLGISAYDAQGQFVGITGLAGQLKDKLGTLTPELRANALAQIFGSDAVRAASVLYEQGQAGIQGWIDKTNDAGYAAETAAKLTDNLSGDLERLKGSLETEFIKGGSGAGGGLRVLTQFLNELVDNFGRLPSAVSSSIVVLTGLGGVALVAGAGILKARQKITELRSELTATGPAGAKTADGIGKVASAAGKAAAAIAIWQAGMAAADQFAGKIDANTEALAAGLNDFGQGADLAGNAAAVLGKDLDNLTTGFQFLADGDNNRRVVTKNLEKGLEAVVPGLDNYAKSLANTQTQIDSVDAALSAMVAGGNLQGANAAFARLTKVLAVNGVTVEEVKKQFPQYASSLEVAADKSNALTGASTKTKNASDELGASFEESKKKAEELAAAFDDLFNKYQGVDQAQIDLRETTISTNEEFRKGSKTLSINSDEGRKNRKAVLERLTAINKMRGEEIEAGVKTQVASDKYVSQIDALKKNLRQVGFTKSGVNDLINKYRDIPPKVDTKVTLTGLNGVVTPLIGLTKVQEALKKGTPLPGNYRRAFAGYSEGGWTGPGSMMDPAGIVHADEFVIRKASRRKIEERNPGLLDKMNETGEAGYAGGGRVWPFPTTASMTRIPSAKEVAAAVVPSFGGWPPSPSAQRGDSGVWRKVVALIRSTGPLSGSFGNGYRPGDPLWHGSGRAVDWMGFNQDALATFLSQKRPLELIHRTRHRDYAYTRGVNKGSFNEGLMQAHRNHVHIAMSAGGRVPGNGVQKVSVADTGRVTLDQGWNLVGNGTGRPETLTTDDAGAGAGGITIVFNNSVVASRQQAEDMVVAAYKSAVAHRRIEVKR